jgi:hypothetical protein
MIKICFALALIGVFCSCNSTTSSSESDLVAHSDYSVKKDKNCANDGDMLISFEFQDSLVGFKNSNNKIVLPATYRMSFQDTMFNYGMVMNKEEDIIGINLKGNFLYEVVVFDNGPDYITCNRFRIKKNGKIGFANGNTGCIEVSPELSYAEPFSEGLAVFCLGGNLQTMGEHSSWTGGKWGVLDTLGKVIVEPIYSSIESFENGKATALLGKKKVAIDKTGRIIK